MLRDKGVPRAFPPVYSVWYGKSTYREHTHWKVLLTPAGGSFLFFINVTSITNQLEEVTYENTFSSYRNRILKFQVTKRFYLKLYLLKKAKQNQLFFLSGSEKVIEN